MEGPAWLGIGAQRSGTTWFTDLLLQHPEMTLSKKGQKELHQLYRPSLNIKGYRQLFEGCAGEWTPYYLRCLPVPPVANKALNARSIVLVLLREPIARYVSTMQHYSNLPLLKDPKNLEGVRLVNSDVAWGGMYATQLEAWERAVGSERMMVLQYEAVRSDPQRYADQVWRRLGLDPIELKQVERPSRTTSTTPWTFPDGLEETLTQVYRPEVMRLEDWGIDLSLWPRYASHSGGGSSIVRKSRLKPTWDKLVSQLRQRRQADRSGDDRSRTNARHSCESADECCC